MFRAADAFGVERIIFCGEGIPLGRKMTKTSRATEKVMPYETMPDCNEVVEAYKQKGYNVVALEITDASIPLSSFKVQPNMPIALVIGDENFGISNAILKTCDTVVHLEMYGQNSSMNVVQATSVTLYEITKQLAAN